MSTPFATRLTVIDDMTLSVECRCGHAALIGVVDLLERYQGNTMVSEVLPALACSRCSRRGSFKHVRIVFMLPEHRALAHAHAAEMRVVGT